MNIFIISMLIGSFSSIYTGNYLLSHLALHIYYTRLGQKRCYSVIETVLANSLLSQKILEFFSL